MDAAFNLAGRVLYEPATFEVSENDSTQSTGPWVVDDDPFQVNQFGHPYQGAMYHASRGRTGSLLVVDGLYLCEQRALGNCRRDDAALSQRSNRQRLCGLVPRRAALSYLRLLLERGPWTRCVAKAGVGSGLSADGPQPPHGRESRGIGPPDAVPYSDIRAQFGVTAITADDSRAVSSVELDQPRVALSMDYGYPGTAGYRHERPFDYFRIETSVSGDGLEHFSTRG